MILAELINMCDVRTNSAHKRLMRNNCTGTYRDGLQEAFDAGTSIMSAVSDSVAL